MTKIVKQSQYLIEGPASEFYSLKSLFQVEFFKRALFEKYRDPVVTCRPACIQANQPSYLLPDLSEPLLPHEIPR
jgi:hypothetical protein